MGDDGGVSAVQRPQPASGRFIAACPVVAVSQRAMNTAVGTNCSTDLFSAIASASRPLTLQVGEDFGRSETLKSGAIDSVV